LDFDRMMIEWKKVREEGEEWKLGDRRGKNE
jgi:hypothetical protein